MTGYPATHAERRAALAPEREVTNEERNALMGMFGRTSDDQNPKDTPSGADETALREKNRMDILLNHGPPGENPSNDPRIEELKKIFGEALQLHGDFCDERFREALAILEDQAFLESPTREQRNDLIMRLESVDLKGRVNPELVILLMSALRGKIDSDDDEGNGTPPRGEKPWYGGGPVDDWFRVPVLYMRFRLTSVEAVKRTICRDMMKTAFEGQSFLAYKTAIDLHSGMKWTKDVFDTIETETDESSVSIFVNKYGDNLTDKYKLPDALKRLVSKYFTRQEDPPPTLEKFLVTGLVDFVRMCKDAGIPTFRGDGFSTPFEVNHTAKVANVVTEFTVLEVYGRFAKVQNRNDNPIWVLAMPSIDSNDNKRSVFWLHDGDFVSDEYQVVVTHDKTILTITLDYIFGFCGAGTYGKALRVSRKTRIGVKTHAVKIFDDKTLLREECESISSILNCFETKAVLIKEIFGPDFADNMCALDQNGPEARRIKKWLTRIGVKGSFLVLKTLPYDEKTFKKPVSAASMKTLIQTVIKCCAFFYFFEFEDVYSDWKLENIIWAGDECMLIDLDLKPYLRTPLYVYYLDVYRQNQEQYGFIMYENEEVFRRLLQPKLDARWKIVGMHNVCKHLQHEIVSEDDRNTENADFQTIDGTCSEIASEIMNPEFDQTKRKVGEWLLGIANKMVPNPGSSIAGGGGGRAAAASSAGHSAGHSEAYSAGHCVAYSSGGSADSDGGRSALLRALSGLGIVVLTAFLRR